MKVSMHAIKALREKTSASLNDIKGALESAGGDETKALKFLRDRGASVAKKRQGRSTGQGRIETYLHHDGRLGAIVEVNCETDFVARTDDFVQFSKNIAMHVAAMDPACLLKEDLKEDPSAACLIEQPFVKDQSLTIQDLLNDLIAKTGENVVIRRFKRFAVGETT